MKDGRGQIANVSLLGTTLVAAVAGRSLLGGRHSVVVLLVAASTLHLVAWACRRRQVRGWFAIEMGALIAVVSWLALPGTTFFGVPRIATFRSAVAGLGHGMAALDTRVPRGIPESAAAVQGRLVLAVVFVCVCAVLADLAAFAVENPVVALLPSLSLLIAAATQSPRGDGRLIVAGYLAAALVFLLVKVQQNGVPVVSGRLPSGSSTWLPAGTVMVAGAVGAALLFPPLLPGYGRRALLTAGSPSPTASGLGPASLVDITATLKNTSGVEMFSVASPVPSYWRLTSLDSFDGRVWSQSGAPDVTGYDVTTGASETAIQDFQIERIQSEFLPAAYRAESVVGPGVQVSQPAYNSVTAVGPIAPGMRYQVMSAIPRPTPTQLRDAGSAQAGTQVSSRFLALPRTLSSRVVAEARRVTSAVPIQDPYDEALTLESYFRDNFKYDLNVSLGEDDDALLQFLFNARRGFCEQFAAAFAVMARSLGLPARVATGFTAGVLEADNRYHVSSLNAHAWPEVYFAGTGWVGFEPTPGRDMPTAGGGFGGSTSAPPATPATTTQGTAVTSTVAPGPGVPTRASGAPLGATATPTTVGPSVRPGQRPGATTPQSATTRDALAVLAFVSLLVLAVPAVKHRRRRSRRSRALEGNDRVLLAWTEAEEALRDFGLGRNPAETMLVHANRAAGDQRLPDTLAAPILVLAGQAGTASYSDREADPTDVAQAHQAAVAIRSELRKATPGPRRIVRSLNPRGIWLKE